MADYFFWSVDGGADMLGSGWATSVKDGFAKATAAVNNAPSVLLGEADVNEVTVRVVRKHLAEAA